MNYHHLHLLHHHLLYYVVDEMCLEVLLLAGLYPHQPRTPQLETEMPQIQARGCNWVNLVREDLGSVYAVVEAWSVLPKV